MKYSTKDMVQISMFVAVLCVLSILMIPMPSGVPFTFQTLAVALCGYVLGERRGCCVVLVYLLLGAIGIPVFSGMRGGISWLFGYTGGFLWGFIPLTWFCGISFKGLKKGWISIFCGCIGLILCHMVGVIQFSLIAKTTVKVAFFTVSVPYLLKDVIFLVGAYGISQMILKRYRINK